MRIKVRHHCPEWDLLLIGPEDPEWEACLCEAHPNCEECGTAAERANVKED